jgi:LL-diaminopimelate aminotransferase
LNQDKQHDAAGVLGTSNATRLCVEPAKALQNLPAYPFAGWNVRCRAASDRGLDVIRLDIGNPDLPPPTAVLDAASEALYSLHQHGYHGYLGTEEFRLAVCDRYERRFGVSLRTEDQVAILLGSKEGIIHLQHALLDPGDVVLVPDPGYTPYVVGAQMAGASVVRFPLASDGGFELESIPLEVARRAKLLWLNYPNNPTGGVVGRAALERAVAFALQHGLLLCHDAAYADVRFGACRPMSVLEIPGAVDVAVEFNSLSKAYNMPGWRIGYAVGNPGALGLLRQVKSNVDSGMFLPLQRAAAVALATDEDWIAQRNAVYRKRLDALASILAQSGLPAVVPSATHYLWVPVPAPETAEHLADRLLDEAGIAVAPGPFFGPSGDRFIRVSATVPDEQVRSVAERLRPWRALS